MTEPWREMSSKRRTLFRHNEKLLLTRFDSESVSSGKKQGSDGFVNKTRLT